jgi:hypothetical protein
MHDCEAYIDRFRLKSMNSQPPDERDPARELNSIATLYCRQLRTEVRVFSLAYREKINAASQLALELAAAPAQADARTSAYDKYSAGMKQRNKKYGRRLKS